MTNEEVETMRAENQLLSNLLNSSLTREAELEYKLQKLLGERGETADPAVLDRIFFVADLMRCTEDVTGRVYYEALIAATGLTERYKKWQEERG